MSARMVELYNVLRDNLPYLEVEYFPDENAIEITDPKTTMVVVYITEGNVGYVVSGIVSVVYPYGDLYDLIELIQRQVWWYVYDNY